MKHSFPEITSENHKPVEHYMCRKKQQYRELALKKSSAANFALVLFTGKATAT